MRGIRTKEFLRVEEREGGESEQKTFLGEKEGVRTKTGRGRIRTKV